jgi:cellobiose-specific phosphotransferase system component IIC
VSEILIAVDSWVIAIVLAALMLAAWTIGRWRGARLAAQKLEAPANKFTDASMAILGLLLAFTFSMSLAKHDQRRTAVVTDSNSIGDFLTCVSMVKEPLRGRLQDLVRGYVVERLELANGTMDDAALGKKVGDLQDMQNQMQALVGEAVEQGTPVTVPLVNTFNEVTSSHATRLAARRDRLPTSIVLMLLLSAILSVFLVGRQQGASGERDFTGTLGIIALVALVVWVTLDLNQPYRGMITVSQEPMQRILSGMGK